MADIIEINDFDINDFCSTYNMRAGMVFNAMKLLERDGMIALTEEINMPSRIKFLVNKNALYDFQVYHFKYDEFVNLIGFVDKVSLKKTNLKKLFKIFKINTFFPMLIMKKIIEGMLKNSYGRILNCSSIGVKFGGGYNSFNYSFSKYALEFIPIAYKEWAKKNVLINNLRIGVTNTKIHKKMNKHQELKERIKLIPMNRMAKPEEISNYISFLISKKNSYMTGETLVASGGE